MRPPGSPSPGRKSRSPPASPKGLKTAERPRVLILGGGFGGLYAAFALSGRPVDVTVLDRNNYHLFQPLLYQVATCGLSPADIAQPIRHILERSANVRVLLGEATAVDPDRRRVVLADGELAYDYLIVAVGVGHSFFGRADWRAAAPGLKDIPDALEIRRRVLTALESAEREEDPSRRDALMSFVVVGGGPTGVELAGALSELMRQALSREFRSIDPARARIYLIEAGPRLLPAFAEELGRRAESELKRRGVEVLLGAPLSELSSEGVTIGERRIPARTALWAAGVSGSPLGRGLGAPLDKAGRVLVGPELGVPGRPDIFVIGDLAAFRLPDGSTLPGTAPVAIQMGRHAAASVLRRIAGEPAQAFRFRDRGMMATIGRHAAVFQRGSLRFSGFFAWLLWLFVHILFLIGLRNRALVLLQWAWAYLTYGRGVRLIARKEAKRAAAS